MDTALPPGESDAQPLLPTATKHPEPEADKGEDHPRGLVFSRPVKSHLDGGRHPTVTRTSATARPIEFCSNTSAQYRWTGRCILIGTAVSIVRHEATRFVCRDPRRLFCFNCGRRNVTMRTPVREQTPELPSRAGPGEFREPVARPPPAVTNGERRDAEDRAIVGNSSQRSPGYHGIIIDGNCQPDHGPDGTSIRSDHGGSNGRG